MGKRRKYYSSYTKKAVEFVSQNQGCPKSMLARAFMNSRSTNLSNLYSLVDSQIRMENIKCLWRGDRYYLFTPDYFDLLVEIRDTPMFDDALNGRIPIEVLRDYVEDLQHCQPGTFPS